MKDSQPKKVAKHFNKDKPHLIVYVVGIISVILIVALVVVILVRYIRQNQIVTPSQQPEKVITDTSNQKEFETKIADEVVDVSDMPNKLHGYSVVGKIVIDKFKISTYILKPPSLEDDDMNDALKYGATEFWGPDINEIGNYCITAHNYKNVFGKIHSLNIGDTFYLVGKDGRKVTYSVTEILPSVKPTDMQHIEQNTDNKRKVTLITCTLSGLTRVIVKAEEKI